MLLIKFNFYAPTQDTKNKIQHKERTNHNEKNKSRPRDERIFLIFGIDCLEREEECL